MHLERVSAEQHQPPANCHSCQTRRSLVVAAERLDPLTCCVSVEYGRRIEHMGEWRKDQIFWVVCAWIYLRGPVVAGVGTEMVPARQLSAQAFQEEAA